MEKLKFFLASIVLLSILGGCSIVKLNKFEGEEQGVETAKKLLRDKYEIQFEVSKNDPIKYEKYPLKDSLVATFYPIDKKEQKTSVWITSKGELKDDYAQYYFKEEAENELEKILKIENFNQNFSVVLEGQRTEENISSDIGVDEYLKRTNSFYEVDYFFENGLSDEIYAQQIKSILDRLYAETKKFELKVNVDNVLIFMYQYKTFFTGNESSEMKQLTLEDIKTKITEQREENEYLKEIMSSE